MIIVDIFFLEINYFLIIFNFVHIAKKLSSKTCSVDCDIKAITFYDNNVYFGGTDKKLYVWDCNTNKISEMDMGCVIESLYIFVFYF